jgi:two-component system, LytTR family, sensor kinase
MSKHRWVPWALLTAGCALLGLLSAVESYSAANYGGQHVYDFSEALSRDLLGWSLWIFFAPLILWLGRRFPVGKASWLRSALVHTAAGCSFALARTLIPFLIQFYLYDNLHRVSWFIEYKYFVLLADFLVAVVVYGLLLTLGHARNYYRQLRENELRAASLETQLARAQLHALRMQIHPHFLFNTLNSISALQLEDTAAAQRMTARLGDFLRLTLENAGAQEVTLRQEAEFLTCYLDIERIRFGRRLTTNIRLDPELLDARVPNLILQPLVENAIKHGIARRVAPGSIDISARGEDGRLHLRVADDGPGLAAGADAQDVFARGVGLSNTRARLDRLYGADYRFELANVPGGGLAVALEIPLAANGDGLNTATTIKSERA